VERRSVIATYEVDAASLAAVLGIDAEVAADRQRRAGLRQGLPFFLDEADAPIEYVNRWLRQLPAAGCHSPRTWKAYAEDWRTWFLFLRRHEADPLMATRDHVASFYTERRLEADAPVAPSTWNRSVAALDNFYDWAIEEGLVERSPFSYRFVIEGGADRSRTGGRRNQARERTGRAHASVRWLEGDYTRLFIEVGLGGMTAHGVEDAAFRGRNHVRNVAFAELLLGAGLRSSEGSHLLLWELPSPPGSDAPFVTMELPAGIAKGGKPRTVWVAPSVLARLDSYVRAERALTEIAWQPKRPLVVESHDRDGGVLNGRRVRWANLAIADRERLVLPDGTSPLLFLRDGSRGAGGPMTGWNAVFEQASERCRALDPYFPKVTPHVLRHSFAMATLRFLINQAARRIEKIEMWAGREEIAGYWRLHDPLLTLRDLLGHASVTTTQIYLKLADPTRFVAAGLEDALTEAEQREAREEELVA
jgi:site-specific recombinase XerD